MAGAMASEASAAEFVTRAQAVAYIVATLPKAIAANPKYLTKADGALTQWMTDEVTFTADGGVVTMREHFVQTKGDKTVKAPHVATVALSDVKIGLYLEPGDVTPSGDPVVLIKLAGLKPLIDALRAEPGRSIDDLDQHLAFFNEYL